jgi:hypothetical protein
MTGKSFKQRRLFLSGSLLAVALFPLATARAEDRAQPVHTPWIITKAQMNKTECTCRIAGQSVPVGSIVCMQNGLFRCQMDQNVTSWHSLASPCPQS